MRRMPPSTLLASDLRALAERAASPPSPLGPSPSPDRRPPSASATMRIVMTFRRV